MSTTEGSQNPTANTIIIQEYLKQFAPITKILAARE